jgi:hypothetical protein
MLSFKNISSEFSKVMGHAGANFNLIVTLETICGIWLGVWLLEAGLGTQLNFFIAALQSAWVGLAMVSLLSFHLPMQRYIQAGLFVSAGALLLTPFAHSYATIVALCIFIRLGLSSVRNISMADAFVESKESSRQHTQLALLFLLPPLLNIILTAITGYIALPGPAYALLFCGILLLLFLTFIGKHTPFQNSDLKALPKQLFSNLTPRHTALYWLSVAHNFFAVPLWFLIMPLVVYEKFDGNPAKLGLVLGLMVFIGLIGQVWRKEYLNQDIPTDRIMTIAILVKMAAVPLWALTYNHPWLGLVAIAISYASAPFWNFGYFAELSKCDDEEHKAWGIYHFFLANRMINTLGFLVLGLISFSILPYVQTLLWLLSAWFTVVLVVYFFLNKRARQLASPQA